MEEACKKLTDAGFTVIAHSQFGISIVGTGELYKKYFNTDVVQPIRLNRQAAEVLRLADGITPQIAHDLMNLDAQVQVSLDGSKPEIYDILHPGQKAFTKCIEGIRSLVAEGHQVTIGTVLSTINIKDIPAIFALTEQLGMR